MGGVSAEGTIVYQVQNRPDSLQQAADHPTDREGVMVLSVARPTEKLNRRKRCGLRVSARTNDLVAVPQTLTTVPPPRGGASGRVHQRPTEQGRELFMSAPPLTLPCIALLKRPKCLLSHPRPVAVYEADRLCFDRSNYSNRPASLTGFVVQID